jgi:hypothetical protein
MIYAEQKATKVTTRLSMDRLSYLASGRFVMAELTRPYPPAGGRKKDGSTKEP